MDTVVEAVELVCDVVVVELWRGVGDGVCRSRSRTGVVDVDKDPSLFVKTSLSDTTFDFGL